MGGIYRNSAGEERYIHDDQHAAATLAGFAPRDAQNLVNARGELTTLTPEQVGTVRDQRIDPNLAGAPDELVAGEVRSRNLEDAYGGFTGGAEALGLGAARGFTLGLSDLLVDPEVAAKYAEQHEGLTLAGNIGGGVALAALTGGGSAALGQGAKAMAKLSPEALALVQALPAAERGAAAIKLLSGGEQLAMAVAAGAAEGAVFGAGQATSALILRNEPLTAEAVFTEYGTDIFLGATFGAVGGAAGYGLEKAGSKLFKRGVAKLDADPEKVLAANALEAGAVPLDSARGKILTEDFLGGFESSAKLGDEFADEIAKRPVLEVVEAPVAATGAAKTVADLPEEMFAPGVKQGRDAVQFTTDASNEAVAAAKLKGDRALLPEIRKVESTQRKLHGLMEADLPSSSAGPNATTVGTGATKGRIADYAPARAKELFLELHDATAALAKRLDDPGIMDNLMLGQADQGIRKGGVGQFLDTAFEPPAPKAGAIDAAVKEGAKLYRSGKDELLEALYVRDGKIASKRTMQVMGEMDEAGMLRIAQAYSNMVKGANQMADALPEHAAKAQLLKAEIARMQKAVRSLVTPEAGAGGPTPMSFNELATAFGISQMVPLPEMDGPADDLAKLWLVSALLKGKFKGAGAETAAAGSKFPGQARNLIQQAGSSAARRAVGWGGNPIVSAIKTTGASAATRWGLNQIMGSTTKLAAITAKAGARAEMAVGKLLQGAGKATRKASPFAPVALMKSVKFADMDHPEGTSEFEKRAREIRMNVASNLGMQKTVHENLGEINVHYPGVADKTIAHADRTMKYLSQKLPRDPGNVMRMGRSNWKASEQDISKFARYMRAALDPDGELERFADGELSVEGAETLRLLYPARFEAFQNHIQANLHKLQDTLSYDQQVQLSVLFDVPVTSCMEPTAIKAFQSTFAADASNQPVSQPPPGTSGPTPLSPAQELLTR